MENEKMKLNRRLGIWMDQAEAHLVEMIDDTLRSTRIVSEFTQDKKDESLDKKERLMNNQEQHLGISYYIKLGEVIRKYREVVVFGPGTAKSELLNLLKADPEFENIKLEARPAGKMTANQQHAFVREYFV